MNFWKNLGHQAEEMMSSDPLGFGTMALDAGTAALDSVTSAFGNIGSTVAAIGSNKIARDTLDYNKWFNEQTWSREDTAVQRRMADLQAAGLNPLLAAGDAATSGGGGMLTAPELQSPTLRSGATELSGILKKNQERKIAQDNLKMAMQERDDQHNMTVKQLKLAENQIKSVELDNKSKTYDNAVKSATIQEQISAIQLKNQQYIEQIANLRSQTQTEATKRALNEAETALAASKTEQQKLETEVYRTYGADEKAAEIRRLDTEYHNLLAQMKYDRGNFFLQSEYQKLQISLQAMANSLYEHDLDIYLGSDKTKVEQDKLSDATERFLANEGVTVSTAIVGLLVKYLLSGASTAAKIGF